MTQTPTSKQQPRPQGPERFQVAAAEPAASSPVQRIGSVAALLALIVGIPALLIWLSGAPPIPTRLPTREDFTQNVGVEQIITILVAVVWLAWLQFVVCVIVELLSAVRHPGIPAPVPLSGPSQKLARLLVGGLLLTGVIGGQVASVVGAMDLSPVRPVVTQSASTTPGAVGNATNGRVAASPVVLLGAADKPQIATPAAAPMGPVLGKKVYTVVAPVGHHHDSLWEIAERHLGDGRRYTEIYALNHDRVQPDGRSLHLARLIQPGWELVMPDDAVGVARVAPEGRAAVAPEGHAAVAPAPVTAPDPAFFPTAPTSQDRHSLGAPSAGGHQLAQGGSNQGGSNQGGSNQGGSNQGGSNQGVGGGGGIHAGSDGYASLQSDQSGVVAQPANPASPWVASLFTSGVFGACVLLALQSSRRRHRGGVDSSASVVEAEVGLRIGADLERTRWVDGALRGLASQCAAGSIAPPQIYSARAGDDEIALHLAPARTDAPEPWRVQDDGRRWVLKRSDLARSATNGPATYPALVSLGRDDEGLDVFIDLEAAAGPVQILGDAVVAGQVATALAIQLATLPWSDGAHVSAVGLSDDVARLAEDTIDTSGDLPAILARLESRAGMAADDVLTGRLVRSPDVLPEYAVLAGSIDAGLASRLAAVTSGSRHPFGVVGVGEILGAQWQLDVDESGRLTMPLLGIEVRAHRMVPQAVDAVAELFTAAQTTTSAPELPDSAVPAPPFQTDDAAFATAEARIALLGPVAVRAPGPIDQSRVPLGEEIVAVLAAHPNGVHPAVLASAIWPRGVSKAVALGTLERVGDWLGTDPDGSARLRTDASGRHSLAPSVGCDWYSFLSLVQRANESSRPAEETELLRRALHLVRGEAFEGRPDNRYSWLARTGLERTIERSVVEVAHRLVELSRAGSDQDGAAAAAGAGLRLARASQLLWRDVLEIEHDRSGPDAVGVAVREMTGTLASLDVPVEPETEALVEHLLGTRAPLAAEHA